MSPSVSKFPMPGQLFDSLPLKTQDINARMAQVQLFVGYLQHRVKHSMYVYSLRYFALCIVTSSSSASL